MGPLSLARRPSFTYEKSFFLLSLLCDLSSTFALSLPFFSPSHTNFKLFACTNTELIVIAEKALLTGGMVLIAPGTSLQLMIAIIIVLGFFGAMLKYRPYVYEEDDNLSTLTHFQILLSLLGGLALLTDHDDPNQKTFSPVTMGVVGIFLNSLSWLVLLVSICMLHPKCRKKNVSKGGDSAGETSSDDDEEEEDHATEKDIQDVSVWGGHQTSSILK